ncbi:MAG: hypothetical protein RLZZ535_2670 [Cyanobacteriota bacterium]|jgi:hypothetical protein
MNPTVIKLIKIASILAMTSALGLSGWNLALHLQGQSLPPNLISLFWLGSIALVAHGVEGIIAGLKARSHNKNPLLYGIYTFFVGFVGLQELAKDELIS